MMIKEEKTQSLTSEKKASISKDSPTRNTSLPVP
jgi:hypothetical protein